MRRIGVFICHCGVNIARTVDVERVAETLSNEKDVAFATTYQYMCSDPGQNRIKDAIRKYALDGVVVGCCTPSLHKSTFMNAAQSVGLNKYNVEIANIREQCSWVHSEREEATRKAISLVRGAVATVRRSKSLEEFKTDLFHEALVIGGGIAGMQSALDIADAGYKVHLVERESSVGGRMAQLDKTFPTLDCSACILTPKTVAVSQHKNIELLTYSEVENIEGFLGNFKVTVKRKSTFVDWDKCNGCGECLEVCPVRIPSEFEQSLGMRPAIYRPFPQAVPNKVVIDKRPLAPCRFECPAGVNAQGYVALASQGKFGEALELEREANPLASICGRVCTHPCESACKRGEFDEPVSIRSIKRFIADFENEFPKPELPEPHNEKVAIIGAGPAGLSCAYRLARQGYSATVFDSLPIAGGMLVAGIPPFRLPRKAVEKDVEFIKSWGVKFELNTKIEEPEELLADGFSAVFIATGAHNERKLGIPGEDLSGVIYGIDFLRRANLGEKVDVGENVVVIGGGNSAIDAARTALRLGAKNVSIIYRRSLAEMPAYDEEISEALEEKIEIKFLTTPARFIGDGGKLVEIECIKMELGEPDESGRRKPVPVDGSEFTISADTAIPTIGQLPDTSFIKEDSPIAINSRWGSIEVDDVTLATSVSGIFAGGDVVTGPASAIEAVAAGNEAAESIRRYLQNIDLAEGRPEHKTKVENVQFPPPYMKRKRERETFLSPEERVKNFDEVDTGLSEKQVIEEASRCLACGGCVECGECEKVCEPDAIVHDMADKRVELNVAAIIVATGYDPFDPRKKPELAYEENPNVITGLEFERILSPSGPTGGEIIIDGKQPKKVVLVHCVGSRDKTVGNEYCSRVCCMYLIKHAHMIKEHIPKAQITSFYMDIRAFGKGYEEFYDRVRDEGVFFRRGSVSEIFRRGNKTIVRAEDTIAGEVVEEEADLVILGTGVVPRADIDEFSRKLRIPRSPDGFFLEAHPKMRPVDTFSDGIFLAGTAQAPRDIPDTVAHAKAAASSALHILSQDKIIVAPVVAFVDAERCSGCRLCEPMCEYNANEFDETAGIMSVNPILCKGCGACATACPSSAIQVETFRPEQIFMNIHALLK